MLKLNLKIGVQGQKQCPNKKAKNGFIGINKIVQSWVPILEQFRHKSFNIALKLLNTILKSFPLYARREHLTILKTSKKLTLHCERGENENSHHPPNQPKNKLGPRGVRICDSNTRLL